MLMTSFAEVICWAMGWAGQSALLTNVPRDITQCLQVNAGTLHRLCHEHFLHTVIYHTIRRYLKGSQPKARGSFNLLIIQN
jgi:hypothetical protein